MSGIFVLRDGRQAFRIGPGIVIKGKRLWEPGCVYGTKMSQEFWHVPFVFSFAIRFEFFSRFENFFFVPFWFCVTLSFRVCVTPCCPVSALFSSAILPLPSPAGNSSYLPLIFARVVCLPPCWHVCKMETFKGLFFASKQPDWLLDVNR